MRQIDIYNNNPTGWIVMGPFSMQISAIYYTNLISSVGGYAEGCDGKETDRKVALGRGTGTALSLNLDGGLMHRSLRRGKFPPGPSTGDLMKAMRCDAHGSPSRQQWGRSIAACTREGTSSDLGYAVY
ncbi:hypothetical protein GWI33_020721 [Rhynchophorus ferrugineus]|uniref:Uncharacterized protein n=1 Tax=Rhynchophorus ferrugineus TaxID=354439 RepID=A0A834HRZ1_RHYFE|nr:hypothetical protein GWI33_020721 [Rhynchophorus ferrugineus]